MLRFARLAARRLRAVAPAGAFARASAAAACTATAAVGVGSFALAACEAPPPIIAPPPANARASLAALESFRGEVAIVTGGATGIGRAVAEFLVEAGARVYVLDIKPIALKGAAEVVQCDVSSVGALQQTIKRIIAKEGGRVDHLVSCAGVWTYGDIDATTEAEFDRILGVNVKGTFFAIGAVLPAMRARKSGSIVVIGSDQSFVGKPGQNLYGMTKGALGQLVKSTAAQYAPEGIRVNAVCPGTIDTPLMRGAVAKIAALKDDGTKADDLVEWLQTAQPLPRLGTSEEVALAVALVSKVPFMTGSLVAVDGGYTCQ